jgi:hypothetical protein
LPVDYLAFVRAIHGKAAAYGWCVSCVNHKLEPLDRSACASLVEVIALALDEFSEARSDAGWGVLSDVDALVKFRLVFIVPVLNIIFLHIS